MSRPASMLPARGAGISILWLIPALLFSSCRLVGNYRSALDRRIGNVLERPELSASTVGIEVRELESGRLVYRHQAAKLIAPASTTKIIPCAGALALLGKDFRFETPVVRLGSVEAKTLRGDLVLVASGDPNLSQRIAPDGSLRFTGSDHTYAGFSSGAEAVPGDPLAVLRGLARRVKEAGIEAVEGAVAVDDGLFAETADEFVGSFSAACVNDGVIDFTITPGAAAGDPAEIAWKPVFKELRVENRVETVAAENLARTRVGVEAGEDPWSFAVRGQARAGGPPVLAISRPQDPGLFAALLFREALEDEGVKISGKAERRRLGPGAYRDAPVVARHQSPPLSEALKVILKVSHNLHATMLPVIIGAYKGASADRSGGYRLIYEYFEREGIDMDGVMIRSGSGGARQDCLSAAFLVDLLSHLSSRQDFPVFLDALPVGGVDGTLDAHFIDPELKGRVRAKTGTLVYNGALNASWLYSSKALAGYLEAGEPGDRSHTLTFAILIGNTVARSREEGLEHLFSAQEDILKAVIQEWH